MALTRRGFLGQAAPWALLPLLPRCDASDQDDTEIGESPFLHGVASGDPLTDRVLLWTRVSPEAVSLDAVPAAPAAATTEPIDVEWSIALDPELDRLVASGVASTDGSVDYTVKVDALGLDAGTTYYYQFRAFGRMSPVGRTKTLPAGAVEQLSIAVVSCANYPGGYFHAYRLLSERDELAFVLHLGDYLYEYGNGDYGDGTQIGRVPEPVHENLTLDDYRLRHAQYKRDPDLQALHLAHPVMAVWDDHEVANDAWQGGAQNHQPGTEGDYAARKAAAFQAYFEWMPVRRVDPADPARVFRSVRIGDLADLILLDTRHFARDLQPADACDPMDLGNPERNLLGAEQEAWLLGELNRSQADAVTWRVLGQQVMMAQLMNPLIGATCVANADQWDGYAANRARLLTAWAEDALTNIVVLTGDIHSSWASDISANPFDPNLYDAATGAGSVAVEFVTPAVSSPGIADTDQAAALQQLIASTHPHIKFAELNRQGYVLLELSRERVQASWYHVGDVRAPAVSEERVAQFQVLAGANRVTPV
jgi:alkaline phosphatase D